MRIVLFSLLVMAAGVVQAEPSKFILPNVTQDLQAPGSTEQPKTRLFIYTQWQLHQVEFKASETAAWQPMVVRQKQDKLYVFGTAQEVLPTADQELRVRGRFCNSVRFTDVIKVHAPEDKGFKIQTVGLSKLEQVPLTTSEIYYGSPYLTPQTIAQARVNHLVTTGQSGHLGSGVINTNAGTLCEGWGCNSGSSSLPMTCVGAGRPYADAIARSRGGLLHRVRFYRGGTWSPY